MVGRFAGKVAFVTGGTPGIGLLDAIGFDAADIGPLAAGRPMEPGQPLYAQSYPLADLRAALGQPG